MAIIEITLNISNPREVIKKEKGKFSGLLAGLLLDEASMKSKVEEKIGSEIIKKLKESMGTSLEERGIKADLSFSLITRQEIKIF